MRPAILASGLWRFCTGHASASSSPSTTSRRCISPTTSSSASKRREPSPRSFGMMNLFARALGGIASDRWSLRWGLRGRTTLLGCTIVAEGLALMLFSAVRVLPLAIGAMMLAGLFVKMSNGATYGIVPFINPRALGAVSGIVGAGGNAGAVLAGFLFKTAALTWPQAILILGAVVASTSLLAFFVRYSAPQRQLAEETASTAGRG